MPVRPAEIVQNCYVVRNLEEACARFHWLYGIGPFVGGEIMELTDHVYQGQPAPPIRLRAVFAQAGAINIELLEPVSTGPDPFNDMFPDRAEGFHHVALFCDDFDATCQQFAAADQPLLSKALLLPGIAVGFIDARQSVGHMIELYPECDAVRDVFKYMRDAAENWDGKDLIIPLG